MQAWNQVSLWMDQLEQPFAERASLDQDLEVDVVIVGAGYTGLWTAYYLKRQAPRLSIAVLEAQTSGFGASGRNGAWLMGHLLGEEHFLASLPMAPRRRAYEWLHGIPDEVEQCLQREGIDAHYRKGGVLTCAARYPEQTGRLRAQLAELHRHGHTDEDYRWLTPQQLDSQVRMAGAHGAIWSPHCATIHPARLVRGLADAVQRLGVAVYDRSPVLQWQVGQVRTAQARVKARWVVPAIEGYASSLAPLGRYQLPVQSLMVATEPLPASTWAQIGLDQGQAFSENSRQVTYAHRSHDDRMVFGARGGYRFGGHLRPDGPLTQAEMDLRRRLLSELFPQLSKVEFTHAWGGNLAMARRMRPHILVDKASRTALAGGYGGEGVGASNLAGRTLADLILGHDTELARMPWVIRDQSLAQALPRWEPEPWRWLAYKSVSSAFAAEDRILADPSTRPWQRWGISQLASVFERVLLG
jgi:glycine/D-amino acid oxidase-like deaminating enzyme